MAYQIKIIRNYPKETIHKFNSSSPYIPHTGDGIIFPEEWKAEEWFTVTSVHHYVCEKLIVVNVNET